MTPLHALDRETGTQTPGACVVRSWCLCGHQFTARASTVRRAKRVIRRRLADHRGHVIAAGPGWQT